MIFCKSDRFEKFSSSCRVTAGFTELIDPTFPLDAEIASTSVGLRTGWSAGRRSVDINELSTALIPWLTD